MGDSEESGEDAGEFLRVPHCEAATPFLMAFILADFSFVPSGACSSFSFDSHACAGDVFLRPFADAVWQIFFLTSISILEDKPTPLVLKSSGAEFGEA